MSLSDSTHDRFSGRVFLGMETPGPSQTTVLELEGKKQLIWDESVDREFLDRVQERARAKAKSILSEAMQQAGVEREIARQRGYDEGMKQAQDEVAAFMQSQSEAVGDLLEQIRAQAMTVWRGQSADMAALVRLAVEKTLRVELDARRGEILQSLLDEAMERLDSQRRLTVRVAPADAEAVTAMVEAAKPRYPELVHFKVKADPRMDAGVVLEAEDGKVDNAVGARFAGVSAILDQLGLRPPDGVREAAEAAEASLAAKRAAAEELAAADENDGTADESSHGA